MSDSMETQPPALNEITEIPLAYRLAHLGIDTATIYPKLTISQIADELELDWNQVRRPLDQYGLEPELIFPADKQEYVDHYPYYALELMREERAWWEWYRTLPQYLTGYQIAEGIGRSRGWTIKTLDVLYPNPRRQKYGRKSLLYPRTAVKKLRDLTFATPPDENWPTMPKLIDFTGHDREWILNRLAQTSIRPEIR